MSTVNSAATAGTSISDLMSTMNAKKAGSTDSVQADTDKFMTLLVSWPSCRPSPASTSSTKPWKR